MSRARTRSRPAYERRMSASVSGNAIAAAAQPIDRATTSHVGLGCHRREQAANRRQDGRQKQHPASSEVVAQQAADEHAGDQQDSRRRCENAVVHPAGAERSRRDVDAHHPQQRVDAEREHNATRCEQHVTMPSRLVGLGASGCRRFGHDRFRRHELPRRPANSSQRVSQCATRASLQQLGCQPIHPIRVTTSPAMATTTLSRSTHVG